MSMYFSHQQIANSITALANVHPFHGITFLACKQANLPVGRSIVFQLDARTDAFLNNYHRLDPTSDWFFQPFKSANREKKWVRPDYSAKGLQAINTQTFSSAFLHERNSRIWGWTPDYISVLKSRLPKQLTIPAFHLAVWLFRNHDWPETTTTSDVISKLINDFHITNDEQLTLFDTSEIHPITFQDNLYSWDELRKLIPLAPDSKPDQGGTLAYLETRGLGPAHRFILKPADRLTLITGDNGLGKTFLLECCWWALTGVWAERPAMPNPNTKTESAEITFSIEGERSKAERKTISFDWKTLSWPQPKSRPTIPGLIVYARVDGSFAVWDPVKQAIAIPNEKQAVFSSSEIWNGLQGRIEGLIRDWVRWQNNPSKYPFETFKKVLAKLSPPRSWSA